MPWYVYLIMVVVALLIGGGLYWAWRRGYIKSDAALALILRVLDNIKAAEAAYPDGGHGAAKKDQVMLALRGMMDQGVLSGLIDASVAILNAYGWDGGILQHIAGWLKGKVGV